LNGTETWALDPNNPNTISDGFGGKNSVVDGGTCAPPDMATAAIPDLAMSGPADLGVSPPDVGRDSPDLGRGGVRRAGGCSVVATSGPSELGWCVGVCLALAAAHRRRRRTTAFSVPGGDSLPAKRTSSYTA
jgi:hypothetical protein